MNPGVKLYDAWKQLLSLYGNPDKTEGPRPRTHLGRYRGIYVGGHDQLGRPILCYSQMGYFRSYAFEVMYGDFSLWADGSFRINYYDSDLKHVCDHTFLCWDHIVGNKVVFYAPQPEWPTLDPTDYEDPTPYFRWGALPRQVRFHLVPDTHSWRIAVHPETPEYGKWCRHLDVEYDEAAKRYLRAARRDQKAPESEHDIIAKNADQIEAISMLLEPYEPARRPKEKAHGNNLASR